MLRLHTEHMEYIEYSFTGKLNIVPKHYEDPYDNWYYRNLALPSDMSEHLVFLENIAKDSIVLELGTRYGVSTSAFAHNAKYVYTVDIDDCSKYIPEEIDNVEFIQGNSLEINYNKYIGDKVDVVLIDTIHTYEQVVAEYNRVKLLNPDVIIFHDMQIKEVERAVKYISETYNISYETSGNVYPIAIMYSNE